MASKKNNPNVQKRIAERKAFVAARPNLSKEVARKRFYVQTRAAELEAAGKTVDRAALRKKFETGTIQRAGFQTQQDIQKAANRRSVVDSSSSAPLPGPSSTPRTPSPMTRTKAATTRPDMMAMRRKPIANFKTGSVQPSKPKPDIATQAVDKATNVFNSVFGRKGAISRLSKATGKELYGMAESTQATFIAPAWNQSVGRIDKRLKVREATPVEAAVTTAATIGSFAAPGGGTVEGAATRRVLGKFAGGRTNRAINAVANEARLIFNKNGGIKPPAPTPVRTGPLPTPPGKNFSASVARPKANATPRPSAKPGEVGGVRFSSPKPVKAPAKKAAPVKKAAAKKAAPQPVAAPAKKAAAKKAAPVKKAAAKKVSAKRAAKIEEIKEKTLSENSQAIKDAFAERRTALKKRQQSSSVTKVKAETVKGPRPKASAPVKAPATKSVPKSTTGRSTTPQAAGKVVEGTPTFKTQADYDKFMDTGGRYKIGQMSTPQQLDFQAKNRRFIIERGRRSAERLSSRANAAERRAAVVARRNKMMLERMARKGLTFSE